MYMHYNDQIKAPPASVCPGLQSQGLSGCPAFGTQRTPLADSPAQDSGMQPLQEPEALPISTNFRMQKMAVTLAPKSSGLSLIDRSVCLRKNATTSVNTTTCPASDTCSAHNLPNSSVSQFSYSCRFQVEGVLAAQSPCKKQDSGHAHIAFIPDRAHPAQCAQARQQAHLDSGHQCCMQGLQAIRLGHFHTCMHGQCSRHSCCTSALLCPGCVQAQQWSKVTLQWQHLCRKRLYGCPAVSGASAATSIHDPNPHSTFLFPEA